MRGSGIVLTDGPGVDVVVAVKGVSACSGKRLVILTRWKAWMILSTRRFRDRKNKDTRNAGNGRRW